MRSYSSTLSNQHDLLHPLRGSFAACSCCIFFLLYTSCCHLLCASGSHTVCSWLHGGPQHASPGQLDFPEQAVQDMLSVTHRVLCWQQAFTACCGLACCKLQVLYWPSHSEQQGSYESTTQPAAVAAAAHCSLQDCRARLVLSTAPAHPPPLLLL